MSFGHQALIAEIVLVRDFQLLEIAIQSLALKLLCGVSYMDGRKPAVLTTAPHTGAAKTTLQTFGRGAKTLQYLDWNSARNIKKNLKYTFDPSDHILSAAGRHAARLTEIRKVRNHIAHGSESSKKGFHDVVRSRYGGLVRGMTTGRFLTQRAGGNPSPVEEYIIVSRAIVKDFFRL